MRLSLPQTLRCGGRGEDENPLGKNVEDTGTAKTVSLFTMSKRTWQEFQRERHRVVSITEKNTGSETVSSLKRKLPGTSFVFGYKHHRVLSAERQPGVILQTRLKI